MYLFSVFNKISELGYFPSKSTEGYIYILPIFKEGNKQMPENYRDVTLLSVFGMLFTRIINNYRLNKLAEDYFVYVGYHRNMWAMDNIFILHSLVNHFLSRNQQMYICYIDFTKCLTILFSKHIL